MRSSSLHRRGFFGVLAAAFAVRPFVSAQASPRLRKNGKTRLATEYFEVRAFSADEIARLFRVPAHMIADVHQ